MKRVIILPLDGFADAKVLLDYIGNLLTDADLVDLLAYVKLNDGVHNYDIGGPAVIEFLKRNFKELDLPIKIFLDLKIGDVSATMVNTLKKYVSQPPDILTVSSLCSVDGIIKLRELLPNTKLALLSALTDISRDEFMIRFGMSPEVKIFNDFMNIREIYCQKTGAYENWPHPEPFDLIVCSPHELSFLKRNLDDHVGFIVPGIRDAWMKKANEHQKRTTGVREALEAGATFVVMGAQLTKGNPEAEISPKESQLLTLQAIASAKVGDPLAVLKACEGYYCSQVSKEGLLGPLVAYAGTYPTDEGLKNYVGYEYFNFAKAEQHPDVRRYFASLITAELRQQNIACDLVLGAPMGGVLLAASVGDLLSCRTIFSEKKTITLADPHNGKKEESLQIIDRHEIKPGDRVIIIEDVCNNFSTTKKLQTIIEMRDAELVAIVCAFNRSGKVSWNGVPVISSLFISAQQFRQNDPAVAVLIAEGNIVWKPKDEWDRLKQAMEA